MTQIFQYSEYQTDYIAKYLRDHENLPGWFDEFLNGFSVGEQGRDDDLEDFLGADAYVPSIGVIRSVAASMANAFTAITWEGIDFQSTNVFDWVASDPTKVSCLESGIVDIKLNIYYAASAVGSYRTAQIYRNGASDELAAQTTPPIGANPHRISVSVTKSVTAGDYIVGYENQDSGGNLNVTATMSLSFLGKAG